MSISIPNATCPRRRSGCTEFLREFLAGKPIFAHIADDFLKFIDGAKIIAHNAEFDMRFLNAELALLGIEPIAPRSGDRHADLGAPQISRRLEQP